jgi:hypothetical protein
MQVLNCVVQEMERLLNRDLPFKLESSARHTLGVKSLPVGSRDEQDDLLTAITKKGKGAKPNLPLNYNRDYEAFCRAVDAINELANVKSTNQKVSDSFLLAKAQQNSQPNQGPP